MKGRQCLEEFTMVAKVTQRSITGPFIYILFVNDTTHYVTSDCLVSNANDNRLSLTTDNSISFKESLCVILQNM